MQQSTQTNAKIQQYTQTNAKIQQYTQTNEKMQQYTQTNTKMQHITRHITTDIHRKQTNTKKTNKQINFRILSVTISSGHGTI